MGIFDSAREQAERLMQEHGDKIEQPSDQALDRLAAEADERTGGQHAEHIDRARDMADERVGSDRASAEPAGIPERIDDRPDEHAPAAGAEGTVGQEGREGADVSAGSHVGIDGPGVPETAEAAAGPTQATTSGSGPAPAAGQDASHAGLTDSVGASEEVSHAPGPPETTGEPGANGGLSSGEDPVTSLAEDLGLAPGASDVADAGQDNGLNS